MITWIAICTLFGISFAGLGYVLVQSLRAGADAYEHTYSESTSRQFEDIFLFIPPKRIAELGWTIAVALFGLTFLVTGDLGSPKGIVTGTLFGCVTAAAGLRFPSVLIRVLRRRRLERFNLQLGDTLLGMSNALRAGFSITQAFESIVRDGENPIAQEFDTFLQETRVGVAFSDALANLDRRVGSEDLTLVCVAINTARRTGGNLTEIFDQIAATIRERLRIQKRVMTLTAQGRLQGVIVGAMPVLIFLAFMMVDPGLMIPFVQSTIGAVIIGAVIVLVGLGGLLIRKIVRIDV